MLPRLSPTGNALWTPAIRVLEAHTQRNGARGGRNGGWETSPFFLWTQGPGKSCGSTECPFIIRSNQKSNQSTNRAKDDHSERKRRMSGDAGLSDTKRACRALWLSRHQTPTINVSVSCLCAPPSLWGFALIAIFDGIMVETFVELIPVSCFGAENETGVSEWRVRLAYGVIW